MRHYTMAEFQVAFSKAAFCFTPRSGSTNYPFHDSSLSLAQSVQLTACSWFLNYVLSIDVSIHAIKAASRFSPRLYPIVLLQPLLSTALWYSPCVSGCSKLRKFVKSATIPIWVSLYHVYAGCGTFLINPPASYASMYPNLPPPPPLASICPACTGTGSCKCYNCLGLGKVPQTVAEGIIWHWWPRVFHALPVQIH